MPLKSVPSAFNGEVKRLNDTHVVRVGNRFYFTGIMPTLNGSRQPCTHDVDEQVFQALKLMEVNVGECGLSLDDVYSVTIMLAVPDSFRDYCANTLRAYNFTMKDVMIKPVFTILSVRELQYGVKVQINLEAEVSVAE
jgi:enamine deaminase RidA (YjgF/YER057c/UK114 family)